MENSNTFIKEKATVKNKNFIVPSDINAEMAVLGAILIDPYYSLSEVMPVVSINDFYKESHQEIYRAMFDLYNQGAPIDAISLSSKLETNNKLDKIGGYTYIAQLTSFPPSAENVEYYAKVVRGKSQMRHLIQISAQIQHLAFEGDSSPHEIVDKAEHMIFEITQNRDKGQSSLLKDLARRNIDIIEKRTKSDSKLTGISSGFAGIDKITNGFQPSDLIVLAARPSMGKTALALNIASNIGIPRIENDPNFKAPSVLIFSLEMSEDQLMQRILSSEARVNASKIRTGSLLQKEWNNLLSSIHRISQSKIQISEGIGLSYYDMRALARRIKARDSLDLIIIDYLQLISLPRHSDPSNRQNEVAEISRNLKIMARELNVPVLVLSQLSRDVEKRQTKEPFLSDLRDSGAIEQDADIVAFIHRPNYYEKMDETKKNQPDAQARQNLAEIIIAKHRNGPTGKVNLTFIDSYTRFEDRSEEDY